MTTRSARSAAAVRTGLVAALAAAVAVGSYSYFSDAATTGAAAGEDTTSSPSRDNAGNGDSNGTSSSVAPFTTADVGACLTWDIAADGTVSNFQQASCEGEHRFEVSARENLATYPSSEFGRNAPMP
ncbi:MAG: hypothetical protein GX859_05905, partial [Corynebacterium humireducens]|nr:hypothetical protein [Corynebacterium humireducens]